MPFLAPAAAGAAAASGGLGAAGAGALAAAGPVGWAALAATALGAGASYFGQREARRGQETAAAIGQFTGAQNNALGRAQYAQAYGQAAPFIQAGGNALNQMLALQGLNQVDTSGLGQLDPSLASPNGIPENAQPLASGGIPVQYAAPGQPGTASQRAPAYYTPDGKIYAEGVGYVGTAQPGQDIPYLVRGSDNTVAMDANGNFTDSGNNVQGRRFGASIDPASITAGQGFNEAAGGGMVAGVGQQTLQNPQMAQQNAFNAFRNTPGYQFAQQEGINAIDKSASARGNLLSGAAIRAQTRYASDLADQNYGKYYDRLAQIAGYGTNATTNANSSGNALVNSLSNSNLATAGGVGSALSAAAASRGTAIQDIGNTANQFLGQIGQRGTDFSLPSWGNLFGGQA